MDQNLINQLLSSALYKNNEILQGLIIKACCLRHFNLSENPDKLTEDEADELSCLQEWFDKNNFDYFLDSDDQLHMRDMNPPEDNLYLGMPGSYKTKPEELSVGLRVYHTLNGTYGTILSIEPKIKEGHNTPAIHVMRDDNTADIWWQNVKPANPQNENQQEQEDFDEDLEEEDDWEPDFDDDWDDQDDDFDSGLSHSQQCYQDRADYAREALKRGDIDEEQAEEIRHGA